MASFLDRVRQESASNWDTDGGWIANTEFCPMFLIWAAGGITTAALKSRYSMTAGQATQLDTLIATRPAAPLLLLNVPAYVQWADKICSVIHLASQYAVGFDTDALVKTALGI